MSFRCWLSSRFEWQSFFSCFNVSTYEKAGNSFKTCPPRTPLADRCLFGLSLLNPEGGVPCPPNLPTNCPFEPMSKRRHGYPSERCVKVGMRIVHGDKLLEEKLGRNDLCPCGSGKRFKRCCLARGRF